MAGAPPTAARIVASVRRRAQTKAAAALEHVGELSTSSEERRLLRQVRAGRDVCWPDGADRHPLVTVRIATYDRGPVVAERALASATTSSTERPGCLP